jgi:hypothetical protein
MSSKEVDNDAINGEPDCEHANPLKQAEHSRQRQSSTSSSSDIEDQQHPVYRTDRRVSSISVKPPPFYRKNAPSWFAQLEAQFGLSRITSSATKFNHCLAHLPEDVVCELDLSTILNYEALKASLLSMYDKSRTAKLDEALSPIDSSHLRPSIAVQKMRRSFREAGLQVDDEVIIHRFIKSLPQQLQITLAPHRLSPLDNFIAVADMVWETSQASQPICALSNLRLNHANSTKESMALPIGLAPFKSNQKPQVCRSHIYYGEQARSCKPWCRWPSKNSSVKMESSSRSASPRPSGNGHGTQ